MTSLSSLSTSALSLSPVQKEAALEFRSKGYVFVKSFLDPVYMEYVATQLITAFQKGKFHYGDKTVSDCFYINGGTLLDSLLYLKCEEVSLFYGEPMLPLYSYCRVYTQGSSLAPHKDNPTLECSITLNIHGTHIYPFYVIDPQSKKRVGHFMYPGDAVFLKGTEVEHTRDRFDGLICFQVFLHYVRKIGPHADLSPSRRTISISDKVSMLNTAQHHPKYIELYQCPDEICTQLDTIDLRCADIGNTYPKTFRITARNIPLTGLPEACMKAIEQMHQHYLDHYYMDTAALCHSLTFLCQSYHISEGGYIIDHNGLDPRTLYNMYLNTNMDSPFSIQFTHTKDVVHVCKKSMILIPCHYTYAYHSMPHTTGGVLLNIRVMFQM